MGKRRAAFVGVVAAGVLALSGCVGGAPSPDQVAGEFATAVEPKWEIASETMFGEPVIRDGVLLMYAIDEAVGMTLTAYDVETGDQLWQHVASPGGAYSNPILSSVDSAGRAYPLPTMAPLVVETGEKGTPAVVFFERELDAGITPDDFLRAADLDTGELLEVTTPSIDPDDLVFRPVGTNENGDVFANVYSPGYRCGDEICFASNDGDESEGVGSVVLDPATMEARFERTIVPPDPDEADTVLAIEWGIEYARVIGDGFGVARFVDGEELWRVDVKELFGVERTSPPDYIDFVEVGDLVLIQGYQPLLETLDPGKPHTYSLDFVESRTLVAVDRETGAVQWRVPGGDMLCLAVRDRAIAADATSIPICQARGGGFVYNITREEMESEESIEASIAQLNLSDGSLGWEVEGAGVSSVALLARLLDYTYSSRGDLAMTERASEESEGFVDLRDGKWYPITVEGAAFVCKAEKDDVKPKYEGAPLASGLNPITVGYPAGWYNFPCNDAGEISDVWMKGPVRLGGYPVPDTSRVVLPTEGGLAAFDLG